MAGTLPFRRVAVIGTGLIGGSFALALRKQFPEISTVGYDHAPEKAMVRGIVHESATDLASAIRGADLVYIALPIGATIESLPGIAEFAEPYALVTDACSTKSVVCRSAAVHFHDSAYFLGGHPMAGKEHSGVEHADAELFRGAPYVLIGSQDSADARAKQFVKSLGAIGAQPLWCDADTHDWAAGIVSHLPQLTAVALARVVLDETDETGMPLTLAGQGLHDTLRLAGSPYSVWRDIVLTNRENISRALDRLAQAIDHLRRHITSREIEQEFKIANELYSILRKPR
jgi:prephenate dehydrogenase